MNLKFLLRGRNLPDFLSERIKEKFNLSGKTFDHYDIKTYDEETLEEFFRDTLTEYFEEQE